MTSSALDRVREQLALYDHPLLVFEAREKDGRVEVSINFKDPPVPVHTYVFELHPRDLESSQFAWQFQRQLYDSLHDYFIEMFRRTPQTRQDSESISQSQ
jgi:hypothetical protein